MQINHLFAYGTLMDPEIMQTVSGLSLASAAAILSGFGRYTVQNEDFTAIIEEQNGRVDGVVYAGITAEAWKRLDSFEGRIYQRKRAWVHQPNLAADTQVMAYVLDPAFSAQLSNQPWCFDTFIKTGKQRFTTKYAGYDGLE